MKSFFLFLGSGGSAGVPLLGCRCLVCLSRDRRNHRLRSSGILGINDKFFLLDPGPDYRQQALQHDIRQLDGVLITHSHYDHIAGFDDLKVYSFLHKKPLPCLLSKYSYESLASNFPHLVQSLCLEKDHFRFQVIENDFSEVIFESHRWQVMTYEQGEVKVTGYRIGNFAYVIDLHTFSNEIFSSLQGVDTLVVSAWRNKTSLTHLDREVVLNFISKVGAKENWLSHISHQFDHKETSKELPPGIRLAYDGLKIDISGSLYPEMS